MQIRRATEEDLEAILALNASIQQQHAEALPKIFRPVSRSHQTVETFRGFFNNPTRNILYNSMKETEYRALSKLERKVIEKLLELNFAGRDELKRQIPDLLAKRIDDNGSLRLTVQSCIRSKIKGGPVAEARYPDTNTDATNRAQVNLLLHVKEGKLWMLEIYKDDSTPVLKQPNPNKFRLFSRLNDNKHDSSKE